LAKSINILKSYFKTGDTPGQEQFSALIDSIRGFRSMAELEACTDPFAEGEIIFAGDFRFRVAPAGATDQQLTLPSGAKLYDASWKSYLPAVAPPDPAVVQPAPSVASPGSVSGQKMVGSALSVAGAAYTGNNLLTSYQWTRNGVNIPGATQASYVPQIADIGKTVARRVTVANGGGSATGSTAGVTIAKYAKAVEWSPLYKSAEIVVTNGTDVAVSSNVLGCARSDRWVNGGKFYFEVAFPGSNGAATSAYVGLSHFNAPMTPGAGALTSRDITFVRLDGAVAASAGGGTAVANVADRATGDTIRVAVDLSAGVRKAWFGTSAGWNGNPASGTGGFPLPPHEFLAVHIHPRSSTAAKFTLKSLAGDFGFAAPTGFVPYGEVLSTHEGTSAPTRADALVEAIGMNTHVDWRGTFWGTDVWKQPLIDLGVRYMRTMIGQNSAAHADVVEMYNRAGIKVLARMVTERDDGTNHPVYYNTEVDSFFDAILTQCGVDKIIGFEGPNEPNEGSATAGWHTRCKASQQYVFSKAKGNAATKALPVLPPTIWKRSEVGAALIGSFEGMADKANVHYYTDGSRPTCGNTQETSFKSMSWCLEDAQKLAPGRTMWVTEYGHRTYDDAPSLTSYTPNMQIAAAYMLRGIFEFFNRGAEKIFLYNLIDDPTTLDGYGLIAKNDTQNFVKRPAYAAVQRLIALFSDPKDFTPKPLRFNLTGNLSEIGHRMFQKSDGRYLLAIWNDAQSWDRSTLKAETIPARTVRLGLEREAATIRRHLPTSSASATTLASKVHEIDMAVPDEIAVYEITLS
jgi:hypothetical protein